MAGDPSFQCLQRIPLSPAPAVRGLYWQGDGLQAGAGVRVGAGGVVSLDTYFGAFFEQHWRRHTELGGLRLRLRAEGQGVARVYRTSTLGTALLAEGQIEPGTTWLDVPGEAIHYRQWGRVWAEVTAGETPLTVLEAAWCTADAVAAVGLAAVFCTFNREADIARVLATLAADGPALSALTRVFVVNQGRAGLAKHPAFAASVAAFGPRLRVIEQDNFGGAGGFTRGMLAALDDPAVSHVVLLDDDIRIEPECLARLAAFFARARPGVAVGGHMLDLLQPTRLYEAGATIGQRNWAFLPQHHMLDATRGEALTAIAEAQAVQYCGWWCFALPVALLREHGLPLPCFIRGDDMEFGLRLHGQGVPSVPLPGVAVWHEPFYVKIGGWQLYYETRNMLVAAALHFDVAPRGVAVRMLKHLLVHLLTFRYYSAALVVRGIEDFLRGPLLLDGPPGPLHASLGALRKAYPVSTVPGHQVLAEADVPALPRTRVGYAWTLLRAVVRQAMVPSREGPPRRLAQQDFGWPTLAQADHIALDTGWDSEQPCLRRSRESFRALGWAGARAIWTLLRRAPVVGAAWRAAAPRLTSEAFWRKYLGTGRAMPERSTPSGSATGSRDAMPPPGPPLAA